MRFIKLCALLYAGMLRLYPPSFRREFGNEMQEVFIEALGDGKKKRFMSANAICFRELRDLPMNLLHAYLLDWKRRRDMLGPTPEKPSGIARFGVLGFGVGFAFISLLQAIVGLPTSSLQNSGSLEVILVRALAYPLGGALGGALFGWAMGSRGRSVFFALGGALAFFFAPRLMGYLAINLDPQSPFSFVLLFMVEPVLIGAIVGILVPVTQENRPRVGHFAFVGALSFVLGRIAGLLVAGVLFWATSHTNLWVTNTASWQLVNLTSIVEGAIGGAILARAAWRAESNGFSQSTPKE